MPAPSFVCSSAGISTPLSRHSILFAIAFAIALRAACPAARAQTVVPQQGAYTITDLGVLPGGGYQFGGSYGYAINASGDVAGYSYTSTDQIHAVAFKEGTVTDLGVVPGAESSVGYGINGSDEVTGYLAFPAPGTPEGFLSHAFLYSGGKMKDLGTAAGYDSSSGNSINDSGQIAGSSPSNGPQTDNTIFLYSDGKITSIAGFYVDFNGSGNNINASGQIAGFAFDDYSAQHAAVFSNNSIHLLDVPITPTWPSQISGINDFGQAAGWLYYPDNNAHAFLYSNKTVTDLGTLPGDISSYGNGINAAGQIVGDSFAAGPIHPFLYTPGRGLIDLNSLLPKSSGWTLTDAEAINDKGQITGAGFNPNGLQRAYLLSPVFTHFSTLNAVLELNGAPATTFVAGGRFTLGGSSKGINPLTRTVVVQLNGYHIAIPPSSFSQTNGTYVYNGKIGNVTVGMVIRPVGTNVYLFGMEGIGAAALPSRYPVQLTLTIGNDTGTEQIRSGYNGPPPTRADLCEYFHLGCNQ